MTILIVILVIAMLALAYALYTTRKAANEQTRQQQQLLTDYQRRVDEQQKLLDDYRALEKNFENVGQGYEQALLAFDKMEEDQQKVKSANEALQKSNAALQEAHTRLSEAARKKAEATSEVLQKMQDAVRNSGDVRMASLVGKLLDLDDLAPDQAPFERTDNIMVSQVADEAVRLSAIDKVDYLTFNKTVDATATATMMSTSLQHAVRALCHLLDNALKFTTEGTVTLSVTVNMEKMQAVYTVTDTGTGIASDDAERIFEPYVKLNQFFDGQGIGLTVARSIARRLGGDIVFDTTVSGTGATFVLSLPL